MPVVHVEKQHGVPIFCGLFGLSSIRRRVSPRRTTNLSTSSASSGSSKPSNSLSTSSTSDSSTKQQEKARVPMSELENQNSLPQAKCEEDGYPTRRKPQRPAGEPQKIPNGRMNEWKLRIVLEKTFPEEGRNIPIWMQRDHYEIWPPRPLKAEDFGGFR